MKSIDAPVFLLFDLIVQCFHTLFDWRREESDRYPKVRESTFTAKVVENALVDIWQLEPCDSLVDDSL